MFNIKARKKASLTVEATLILPIVLLAIISFLYFFQIVLIREEVQKGISEVARTASKYAYIYEDLQEEENENPESSGTSEDTREDETSNHGNKVKSLMSGLVTGASYQLLFQKQVDQSFLNHSWIQGGCNGILFLSSKFMKGNEDIDIVAAYRIKIPFTLLGEKTINCVQRVKTRGFVGVSCVAEQGKTEEDEEDPYVYITATGSVYHKSRECPSLNLKISSCQGRNLAAMRNKAGGKYKPCERCMRHMQMHPEDTYYITKDGDRYHCDRSCSGLKRDIKRVHLSEVGGRRACKRCGR